MAQEPVVDDPGNRLDTDVAMADPGVAVLAAAARVEAVVEMDGAQPLQADDRIELGQDPVEIVDNVVPGIMDVTGVETDPHLVLQDDPIEDAAQFLKAAADLAALAGHGFEQDGRRSGAASARR